MEQNENRTVELSLGELAELNRHRYRYAVNPDDLRLVNELKKKIEARDWDRVRAGDDVKLAALKSGRIYEGGHIEKIDCGGYGLDKEPGTAYCCTEPYVPFVHRKDGDGIYYNTSGGYWVLLDRTKFQRMEIKRKLFVTFEGRLPEADGAVYFWADVVRWFYMGKEIY